MRYLWYRMANGLTLEDYCEAARLIDCPVSSIKAVATVESGGRGGFDSQGRILIRFEGHVFRRETRGRYNVSHPHLSYPYSLSRYRQHGRAAFNRAFALDPKAALLSTSWGMFQPMGFNFMEMDYESVDEMVTDLSISEKNQLMAFARLVIDWGLADELKQADLPAFTRFARQYNGPDFKTNRYHSKMLRYKKQFDAQGLDCPEPMAIESEDLTLNSTNSSISATTHASIGPAPGSSPLLPCTEEPND